MKLETKVIHAGQKPDAQTGAVMTPIYATSTYAQSSPGEHKGYDYARTRNPTRDALEACLAELESGKAAFAFASESPASCIIAATKLITALACRSAAPPSRASAASASETSRIAIDNAVSCWGIVPDSRWRMVARKVRR